MFLILGVMGGLALVLGLLLVYNTITALIGQQITQIGVMKAIGAGAVRILLIYFSGMLIYGALALVIAVPLSILGAQQFSNFLLYVFNLDPGPLTLSSTAVLVQMAIALLAPLLAALVPVSIGARITVREMLAAMAVIIALVGSIALSGVLSLNVRERTREIGVMRAIGASSWAIARLFIGEGLILGLLSWLIALPLSLPAGYLMTKAIGGVFSTEIIFHYTPTGALYWLVIITGLAVAASWLPAYGAGRVSVRESLAYQ